MRERKTKERQRKRALADKPREGLRNYLRMKIERSRKEINSELL